MCTNASLTGTGLTPNFSDYYEFPEMSAQRRSNAMREYRQLRKIFMAVGVKVIKRPQISSVTFQVGATCARIHRDAPAPAPDSDAR
jgi:hypothetical protein